MVDINQFRNGMAQLGGAVNVVTTQGSAGLAGFTATAVCSVTDQPPTLLVCLNRSSFSHLFFTTNGVLCVNVLSSVQQDLSGVFASRDYSVEERFARAPWTKLETGSPAIDGALVNFDCRIVQTLDVGTHSVFYCEVEAIRLGEPGAGLVYFNRAYHHLSESTRAPS